jgi:hypothetical protein
MNPVGELGRKRDDGTGNLSQTSLAGAPECAGRRVEFGIHFPLDPEHHLHGREDFEWMKAQIFLFRGKKSKVPFLVLMTLHQ